MFRVRNAIHFRNNRKRRNTMGFRRLALAIAAAAVLVLGLAIPGTAKAATTVPYTGSGCNTLTIQAFYNCTTVNGGGLKISSISGYTVNANGAKFANMHVEIYGPRGLIKNCGNFTLPSGIGSRGPTCTWTNPSPNANEPAGDYCSVGWQYIGNGGYAEGGPECVGVHS